MKKSSFSFVTLILMAVLLAAPCFAKAAVVINEVAWMGTAVSANNEWLELYNNGNSEVDLNGWTLKAADGSPEIDFSSAAVKTIPASGFYLLERTDDSSVPEVKADAIYTGALSNDGEVLILKDKEGTEVDRVDAGSKWPAGDNAAKLTMQKADGGWITAAATPKAANASGGQSSVQASSAASGVAQASSFFSGQTSQSGSVAVAWPVEPRIYANAGGNKSGVAGAGVLFEGAALGFKEEPLENARYLWNFGDGSFAEGKNVRHFYKYPGEYIAVLDVASGQYSASDRVNVKIVPSKLEIIEAGGEFIKFKNGSDAEVDVSGWFVKSGQNIFTFPANSFIGAGATLTLSSDVSKIKIGAGQTAELLYPSGSIAFSFSLRETPSQSQSNLHAIPQGVPISTSNVNISSISPAKNISSVNFVNKNQKPATVVGFGASTSPPENQAANIIYAAGERGNPGSGWKKWLYLSLGLGIFGGGGLFLVRRDGGA